MTVDDQETDAALFPERVGDRLRSARVKAGLDLSDVAARTRVPLRHLIAIEAGDYQALPAKTYAMGFVKAYARAVDADEVSLGRDLRTELGMESGRGSAEFSEYDTADPARVPPRLLAWTALAVALLVGLGYAAWRGDWFSRDDGFAPVEVAQTADPAAPGTAPAPTPAGAVLLTATDTVWLRIYDAGDKVLKQGEMKAGESFAVPADATSPMIRTGQPQLIKVTIGGREVAQLGEPARLIKDVGISAAALTARVAPPAPAAAPATTPANNAAALAVPPAPQP